MKKRVHFIAIGGSVMHNLALALAQSGFEVSGSDDQIYEPARSRLAKAGILPDSDGWFPEKLAGAIDFVILGMHAKTDNPELRYCLERGIQVFSFPQFIQESYRNKKQIVVIGSHGKTTTTSILMHLFKALELDFDYLVGSQLEGFDTMVRISNAPFAIIEGDEYLSSCLDLRPKFFHYDPSVLIVTGIAWDHFNVFPTFQQYLNAFRERIEKCSPETPVIYFEGDPELRQLVKETSQFKIPYQAANSFREGQQLYLVHDQTKTPIHVFGKHNLENIQAAIETCRFLGFDLNRCFESLTNFKGAAKRMELIFKNDKHTVFRDFAHAPSKLKASLQAIREQFPNSKILACYELHTYSSLNPEFLPQYKDTAAAADELLIYFDANALAIKKMLPLSHETVRIAFQHEHMFVVDHPEQLIQKLNESSDHFDVIIFAGSGNFGKVDLLHGFDAG